MNKLNSHLAMTDFGGNILDYTDGILLLENDNWLFFFFTLYMEKRDDVYKNRGLHEYGDVKFADSVNDKYPIDNEEHIRAAWSYIHMPRNSVKYDDADLKTIKNRIIKAWKEKINPEGPPEAEQK